MQKEDQNAKGSGVGRGRKGFKLRTDPREKSADRVQRQATPANETRETGWSALRFVSRELSMKFGEYPAKLERIPV